MGSTGFSSEGGIVAGLGTTLNTLKSITHFDSSLGLLETEVSEAGASEECVFHLGRKSPGPQC